MAKLIKSEDKRPSNSFLIAAPCATGVFNVTGSPGLWEVEIPDENEFAITYALAFGGWKLASPSIWAGSFILNHNGVTDFTFRADDRVEIPVEPESDDAVEALREELTAKGKKFDKRWGAAKLRAALEDAE